MDARTDTERQIGERAPLIIRRVDAIPVGLPLKKPMAMAGSTVSRALNILVRIEAADGTVGWGEAASAPTMTGDTLGGLVAAVRDHLAPLLVGEDAWMRPALCRELKARALSATPAPIRRSRWRCSISPARRPACRWSISSAARCAARSRRCGCSAIRPPSRTSPRRTASAPRASASSSSRSAPSRSTTEIAATLALRDALGAETPLCADANCGLSFADAQPLRRRHARRRPDVRRAAARARRPRRPRPADAAIAHCRSAPTRASTRSPTSRRTSAAASAASRSS